jgi:hypothetical protein
LASPEANTTVMVTSVRNLHLIQPHRKKRDGLYRMFQRFFGN